MRYSYNQNSKDVIFASASDLNASFKDLCAVCDSIRYKQVASALAILEGVINGGRPIEYKRHNKYMGSRHELGGKKGRYPIKCAILVKNVMVNASANAKNKGEDPDMMYVVHATANKTQEIPRAPPKGVRAVGGSRPSVRRSNIAFAKIEIGIAPKESEGHGARVKRALNAVSKREKPIAKAQPAQARGRPEGAKKPLDAPVPEKKEAKQQAGQKDGKTV